MVKTRKKRIAVIGGGPAGLAAAIAAAQAARTAGIEDTTEITLVEKQERVGRKLLATGNGRCNLANSAFALGFYHSASPEELKQSLQMFDLARTTEFFRGLGVLFHEEGGRLYPYSRQASAVLDALRWKAEELGVRILCGHGVADIALADGNSQLADRSIEKSKVQSTNKSAGIPADKERRFVLALDNGERLTAERVLVACGGLAAPQMGGAGDGYRLLRACGHTLEPTFPALAPLRIAAADIRILKGIRVLALTELLTPAGKCLRRERGEVLFTDYGVSGIVIMQLSRQVSRLEHELKSNTELNFNTKHSGNTEYNTNTEYKAKTMLKLDTERKPGPVPLAQLRLDLLENWQEEPLARWLGERAENAPLRPLGDFLVGIVPKRVGQVLLRQLGLDLRGSAGGLTEKETQDMAHILKNWHLPVSAAGSWQQAQVTAGGIRLSEFAPQTLESLHTPGLYAAGEVLDVDGDCGGYNLQWAWTSGCLAGRAAARSLREGKDTGDYVGGGFPG